jgi:YD repeat-containing protein
MLRRTTITLIALAAGLACSTAASAGETIQYTYDARGRLVKVFHTAASTVNQNVQACYRYDKADNRTKVTLSGASASPPAACP